MLELKGPALAVTTVAFAEAMDFMMSATSMHTPPFMVARYIIKILVALIIFVCPSAFRHLLSRKAFCTLLAISGCIGVALVFAFPNAPSIMVGTILVSGSETCLFVGQALVLLTVRRQEVLKVTMAGVLLAFGIGVIAFVVPVKLSFLMQVAVIVSLSILVNRTCLSPSLAHSDSFDNQPARTPIIPWSLTMVLVLFSFGTQFDFMQGNIDCDWAQVYALGALAGFGIMVLELRVFASSKISVLDITCALFIAVPVMLAGMNNAPSGTFMSLVNVGDCLFLPRVFQVILRSSEEDQIDPVKGFSFSYIIVTLSVMLATLLGLTRILESANGMGTVIVSVCVTVGCIFSAFILYSARIRDDAFEYIRTNERDESSDSPTFPEGSPREEIPSDSLRQITDELYLTRRETEVLTLLLRGCDLEEVGEKLCIAMSTVKTHVLHIYQKFNVHSKRELFEAVVGKMPSKSGEKQS